MSFQGKINTYTCPTCKWQRITRDLDDGVTPMFIRCENGCDSHTFPAAASALYRVDQSLTPTHEWYRPTDAEAWKMNLPTYNHVQMGGLVLRKIP